MFSRIIPFRILVSGLVLQALALQAFAGGPKGAFFNGNPVRWNNTQIPLILDNRDLGPFTAAEALDMVRVAAARWQDLPDSDFGFTSRTSTVPFQLSVPTSATQGIVFDNDGLLDDLLGAGASQSIFFVSITFVGSDLSVWTLLNGQLADSTQFDVALSGMIGDILALGPSMVGDPQARSFSFSDNDDIPVLYPVVIPGMTPDPKVDDAAWAAQLYPESGSGNALISGRVTDHLGDGIRGAHVIAVQVDAQLNESTSQIVGCYSDWVGEGDGAYVIPNLAPGNYVVFMEPVPDDLVGVVSLFSNPFRNFTTDYFNGPNESSGPDDDLSERTIIQVGSSVVTQINLIVRNRPPRSDAGDDQIVTAGSNVNLQGSGSDQDGDSVLFSWTQISGPNVSVANRFSPAISFEAPSVATTTLIVFQLRTSDQTEEAFDTVRIAVTPEGGSNTPPIVDAGPDIEARPGEVVQLLGTASDADGDQLLIDWIQQSGSAASLGDPEQLSTDFQAPDLEVTETLVFRLRANDGRGGEVEDEINVLILVNNPPEVTAGASPGNLVRPLSSVTLEADASDPNGDELSFSWTQTAGPTVDLEGASTASATFTPPTVERRTTLSFEVDVSDGEFQSKAEIDIIIEPFAVIILPFGLNGDLEGAVQTRRTAGLLSETFVGTAFVNSSQNPNPLGLKALDAGGGVLFEEVLEPLPPFGQLARLTTELVSNGAQPVSLRMQGRQGDLQGFFLVGDSSLLRLDGIGGALAPSEVLFFGFARQTESESTLVYLHNPEANGVQVTLRLFDSTGISMGVTDRFLGSDATLLVPLTALFGDQLALADGYLRASAVTPLQGFVLRTSMDSFAALRGQPAEDVEKLSSPQFFVDPSGGSTEIRLLNHGQESATANLEAFDDSGQSLGSAVVEVEAANLFVGDVAQLLGIEPDGQVVTGYLDVDFPGGASVNGAVTFSANQSRTRSMLPLLKGGLTETVFLQVAQSAASGLFTGVAVVNNNPDDAQVTLRVYDNAGQVSGESSFTLAPGERRIGLLNDAGFLGEGFEQTEGHFRVLSDVPVLAFALFGDFVAEFLSAIEGQAAPVPVPE